MDHMQKYWSKELECIRKGVNKLDGYITTISTHYMRDRYENNAYSDRVFDELDIVWAIANGHIVEGFDSGDKGRNPEPERTIIGPAMSGDWAVVIVLMKTANRFIVKTVFPAKNNPRYSKHISKVGNKN
jgi:hypothetical protein